MCSDVRSTYEHAQLVSVITVCLNERKHIEQTILSVLGQTYPNVELVVIDGGSEDGSLDIISKYKDQLVYWESGKDRGISDAFNRGACRATGEVIAFLNGGDWYAPQTVEMVLKELQRQPRIDICYGDVAMVGENGESLYVRTGAQDLSDRSFRYGMPSVPHPTVFARRRWVVGYPFVDDLSYAMDYEWMRRVHGKGARFFYARSMSPLAYMRVAGKSNDNYHKTLREVHKISMSYGDDSLVSFAYNRVFRMGRYTIRSWLETSRLGCRIVALYRRLLVSVGWRNWKAQ